MHDCPECGEACDCDGEDTWFENYPNCAHQCAEEDDDDVLSNGYWDRYDTEEAK
jgi:hypothetical protein